MSSHSKSLELVRSFLWLCTTSRSIRSRKIGRSACMDQKLESRTNQTARFEVFKNRPLNLITWCCLPGNCSSNEAEMLNARARKHGHHELGCHVPSAIFPAKWLAKSYEPRAVSTKMMKTATSLFHRQTPFATKM